MKLKEIRDLSGDELVGRKRELRMESFNLRLQQQSGQMEKPSRVKDIRKEVARIETILSERTRQPQTAQPAVAATKATKAPKSAKAPAKKAKKS